jgi:hypothetical protein
MISDNLKCVFIHIQKTGGDSIETALGLEVTDKHFLARQLNVKYDRALWNHYFKFAFVRNPWDRLVSWYSMIENARGRPRLNGFFRYVLTNAASFEDFILRCTDQIRDDDGDKCIYTNQIEYLVDMNGTLLVDFVGRFERLQQDFDQVCSVLGIETRLLPRLNHGSRHEHYSQYYSDEMREFVSERYKSDIEYFGFAFEHNPRPAN